MEDSFEIRLQRLETIAESLRKGSPGLEEAGKLFEEGIKLARGLEKDLSKLERKIEVLVKEDDGTTGTPVLELFPELGE